MWLLVFCVSSSLIHILTSYGIWGCQCYVSLPHSYTYSLLMTYVAVSVLCIFLTHPHTHFLWRMWLLCTVSLPYWFSYSLLMAYVAVSILCLFLIHPHTHFLWRVWLLVTCVSSSLIHILTSYGVCGCYCSVSLPHSLTYSLFMTYVAVSVLCLFLAHLSTHFLWHMWMLVFCVSTSLIHILTSYGVCGCKCSVSRPHLFTYSLLMTYVAVSVLCLYLTYLHTHFLWRMWL